MNLKDKLDKQIRPNLARKYKVPILALPRIEKVTINSGVGKKIDSKDAMAEVERGLALISGQKPKYTVSKQSISGFKIRKGQKVGFKLTLRGKRMWDFIERLINVVLPRIRDFSGLDRKTFDKNLNMTLAIKEQLIFPEIKADEIKESWGMSITMSLKNSQNREIVEEYLKEIGFIFK